MVMVYHFRVWDHIKGETVIPPLKRPSDRIRKVRGEIILETGEDVPLDALDDLGRYDPSRAKQ
jgi:hypothetical protein